VILTPEEWVRQHFIMYIIEELQYPSGLITIEKGLLFNSRQKRSDIVVHNNEGMPWMIIECKAPKVKLTEAAFYQAASYHMKLQVKYLIVTNGLKHFCCKFENDKFEFIDNFPAYST